MLEGYKEAEKIDHLINSLFEKYSVNKENGREWLAFTRTVITTLQIIRDEALMCMKGETIPKKESERSELELLVDKITDTLAVKLWDTIFGILERKEKDKEDEGAFDYILELDDKELEEAHNLITAKIRDRKEEDEREEKDGRS